MLYIEGMHTETTKTFPVLDPQTKTIIGTLVRKEWRENGRHVIWTHSLDERQYPYTTRRDALASLRDSAR
jgi:hypothetical protein